MNISDLIIFCIFFVWLIFFLIFFDFIDFSLYLGEVILLLFKEFWFFGFQDIVLLGDCIENWILLFENYDVSSVIFSNYKNYDIGKIGIWMILYGGLVMCIDIYFGGIIDNELIE